MKKIVSIILTVVFMTSLFAVTVYAVSQDETGEDFIDNAATEPDNATNPEESTETTKIHVEFIRPGRVTMWYGAVNIEDVTAIQRYLAGLTYLEDSYLDAADFDGDGVVSITDATNIQRKLAALSYNCVVYPDDNYLSTFEFSNETENTFSDEYKIEYVMIDECAKNNPFGIISLDTNETEVVVIHSREEFFALFDAYSPYFDDEFFEENALVVFLRGEDEFIDDYSSYVVDYIGVNNNELSLNVNRMSYENRNWYVDVIPYTYFAIYQVKKEDVTGITTINVHLINKIISHNDDE